MKWEGAMLDREEIELLKHERAMFRKELDYAYRCIHMGFAHGNFDFSILKKEAATWVMIEEMNNA
jgi:hypothetical protein